MKTLHPSTLALAALTIAMALFCLSFIDAALLARSRAAERAETAGLAAGLGLADLALFNEARYTRHPAQADLHSAFQDHPLAFDHFPTGSLMPPRTYAYELLDRKTAQPD
ncbi:hypothetical protein F6R98_10995 [Candidatus Methylospira mobilis]|uniref:Uncharacterized protein n=1 Tax=Candidatus Methylospira mobilis TaxID=1808979 RepID=A0A5Q0BLI9_9GAMM|nr:hypothetical protein [Candidatus Methylospira mobilis]QFY43081.1 hypothetical protein F6R98_10995 [Candidatus Methylospira mobilis]WNV03777.1 hypothetical protein RP726_15225 [Candidatus Methylospira mobilis]